jgi:hypothetical protein
MPSLAALSKVQVNESAKKGEKLAVHEAPQGVEIRKVISIEQERSITNTKKSIKTCLLENESTYQFALNLASELKASPGFSLLPGIKTGCVKKFRESFQNTFSFEKSVTERKNVKFELTYTINSDANERYLSVAVYQKYSLDLCLAYIDYLFVDYRKSLMGLRKKRQKYPPVTSQVHPNVVKFNTPLTSIHYWKLLPKSAMIVNENSYKNEVDDPQEIIVKEPDNYHKYYVAMPDVPTLYQISNVAFPLRWIKRKGDWTEEELKEIEWEEAKDTAWWFNYGPG